MIELNLDAEVLVAGHRGLVGSASVRRLETEGFSRILTATREQLDLRDQAAVRRHRIELRDGIESSCRWFLENRDRARGTEPGAAA